jgi:hypothetical protein
MGTTPSEMRNVAIQLRGTAIQMGVIPFLMGKPRNSSANTRIPDRRPPLPPGKAIIRIEDVPLGLRKAFIRLEEAPVELRDARIPA